MSNYRICKKKDREENPYYVEIEKVNRFGQPSWIRLEDDNDSLVDCETYYSSVSDCQNAILKHHKDKKDALDYEVVCVVKNGTFIVNGAIISNVGK